MAIPTATIAGAGVTGLVIGAALARRGWSVELLHAGTGGEHAAAWSPVPADWGRGRPHEILLEESLPLDLVLPGEHRVPTPGRVSLVDHGALRAVLRREAEVAGVRSRRGRAVAATRRDGIVTGVRLEGGGRCAADLTIDASGGGVLLASLPGAALAGGRLAADEREPVALVRAPLDPRRVQTAWAGRAQLRLDLPGPGALGWRCTARDGTWVWGAATAGRGTTRSAAREVLQRTLAPVPVPADTIEVRWQPCRRPLDRLSAPGLLVAGAAAACNDALMGVTLPDLLPALEGAARALAPSRAEAPVDGLALHRAGETVLRGAGGRWAARALARRLLDRLGPGGREGLVLCGAAGARAWWRALQGAPLLDGLGLARALARGLPRGWAAWTLDAHARACALRAHHRRYPSRHELFELDRWQAREERLFGSAARVVG